MPENSDLTKNSAFWKMVLEAVKGSVCVLLSDGGENCFSGVFVEDKGRYFIVTASHCLDDIKDATTLLVSTFGNQSMNQKVDYVNAEMLTRKNKNGIDEFDIGAIEISKTYADRLNGTWLGRSNISSELVYTGATIVAVGFPSDRIKSLKEKKTCINPTPFLFISQVTDKRPELSSDKVPIDPYIDIMLHYDSTNILVDTRSTFEVHPGGMSGCGLFSVPLQENDILWDASHIRLAAIQSSFIGEKYLRGKRSECILKLLDEMART